MRDMSCFVFFLRVKYVSAFTSELLYHIHLTYCSDKKNSYAQMIHIK